MPDYSNGKIYTIRCKTDDSKIYVGSTIQPLYKRFSGHKIDSKREKRNNMKLYIEVNNNWDDWYIELYENYPCSCKEELHKREGEIIRLIGTLNNYIAGRDYKQYCFDNFDIIREYRKQYKIENADIIKQYRIENADKIKERTKQYRIENADKIREQKKEWYLKNKNKTS